MEKLLKYTPLMYAALVVIGYVRQQSFYSVFGIEIWHYTSLGEVLVSFVDVLGPALFAIVVIALCSLFFRFSPKVNGISMKLVSMFFLVKKQYDDYQPKNAERPIRRNVWTHVLGYGMVLYIFYLTLYVLFDEKLLSSDAVNYILGGGFSIAVAVLLFDQIYVVKDSVWVWSFASVAALLFTLVLCAIARDQAHCIERGCTIVTEVEVHTEDEQYVTGEDLRYVNECNAAVFLYNASDSATLIIPRSEVVFMKVIVP